MVIGFAEPRVIYVRRSFIYVCLGSIRQRHGCDTVAFKVGTRCTGRYRQPSPSAPFFFIAQVQFSFEHSETEIIMVIGSCFFCLLIDTRCEDGEIRGYGWKNEYGKQRSKVDRVVGGGRGILVDGV